MYWIYRISTFVLSPLIPVFLAYRLKRGKEDKERQPERFGIASLRRPAGEVIWIHAASVGESNSVLPLIEALRKTYSSISIVLTTVTVTSATLMQSRLPAGVLHQFAPVDTVTAVNRFLDHWRPDMALWVDSEFWPNTVMETRKRGIIMGIANARMSETSFHAWQRAKSLVGDMLSCFAFCFAQSEADGARLLQLGLPAVTAVANLKYDAPPLPSGDNALGTLKAAIGTRRVWVAASTHPGEELLIASVHQALKTDFPDLLTVIVPRHAIRGGEIAAQLSALSVAQRSRHNPIKPETDIYLADTMGELGLFYRLADITFIGGTLVPHGGQNPLEAARLGCSIVLGPHYSNFADVVQHMRAENAVVSVASAEELANALRELLVDSEMRRKYGAAALRHAESKTGAVTLIMNELQHYLS